MLIYKIFRRPEWQLLDDTGETEGAPIDVEDGFVHFSTAEQVRETAARHFAGETNLVLAAVEAGPLGSDLKWEASRGGALFPHLYRTLRIADIAWVQDLIITDGVHQFPEVVA